MKTNASERLAKLNLLYDRAVSKMQSLAGKCDPDFWKYAKIATRIQQWKFDILF